MPAARPPRVFRVTGAAWLLGLSAAIAIVLLIEAAVRSGVGEALLLTPWLLLVIWVVYVMGIASMSARMPRAFRCRICCAEPRCPGAG